MLRFVLAVVASMALLTFAHIASNAQEGKGQTAQAYLPDVGELMAATQLRHFKLSFAGTNGNWPLADYEIGQMRKNLSLAAKLYPTLNGLPLAQMIKDESEPPLDEIAKAVAAKDPNNFGKAFAKLTEACNRCHQAAGVGFVSIRVPTSSPFSNQTFAPPRP
jgi:hypothetical protein